MPNKAAQELGRLGGKKTSEAKAAAARANAKRPRPNARGKKKPRRSDKSNDQVELPAPAKNHE